MTLRTKTGLPTGESVEDVAEWLRSLEGCPSIDRTVAAECRRPAHGDEPATWWFVEADPHEGVARLRCLACGDVRPVLDSADRWSYPTAWACGECRQSIAEVMYGVHMEDGVATWLALAVRCVNCNDIAGVADFVVPAMDVDALVATL
jgi:hypothetical protein